jgi:hypothetical protein
LLKRLTLAGAAEAEAGTIATIARQKRVARDQAQTTHIAEAMVVRPTFRIAQPRAQPARRQFEWVSLAIRGSSTAMAMVLGVNRRGDLSAALA